MDLGAWQREFELWIRTNFPDQKQELQMIGLVKEAVHQCRTILERAEAPHGIHAKISEDILQELGVVITAATWIAFLSSQSMGNVLLKSWAEGLAPEQATDIWRT